MCYRAFSSLDTLPSKHRICPTWCLCNKETELFSTALVNKRSRCFSILKPEFKCFLILKWKEFPCSTRKRKRDGKGLQKKCTLLCYLSVACWREYVGRRKLLLGNNRFQFCSSHYPKNFPNAVYSTVCRNLFSQGRGANGAFETSGRLRTSEQVTVVPVVLGSWKGSLMLSNL